MTTLLTMYQIGLESIGVDAGNYSKQHLKHVCRSVMEMS